MHIPSIVDTNITTDEVSYEHICKTRVHIDSLTAD